MQVWQGFSLYFLFGLQRSNAVELCQHPGTARMRTLTRQDVSWIALHALQGSVRECASCGYHRTRCRAVVLGIDTL